MSTIEPIKSGLGLRILEGSHQRVFHPLTRSVVSIGRATPETPYSSSYITIPEATLSRLHAVFTWEPGARAYMLHHRSQTNPTVLNGARLTGSHLLKPGDILALGRLVMILEESDPGAPPSVEEAPRTQLLLNMRSKAIENNRIFRVPVEKPRILLVFTSNHGTEALNPDANDSSTQRVIIPAAAPNEVRLDFNPETSEALVESQAEQPPVLRKTVLGFGKLSVACRASGPLPFLACDVLEHQGTSFWLSTDNESQPPTNTIDEKPAGLRTDSTEPDGGSLYFLNGAWKGAEILVATRGSTSFELGPNSRSLVHKPPLQHCPSCQLTVQNGKTRIRAVSVDDDQFIDVNGDLLFAGESTDMFSGTKILLGDAEFLWLVKEDHNIYSRFQLNTPQGIFPFTKAVVKIGTAPHCEINLRLPNMAPVTGEIRYTRDGFTYTHRNLACPARVDGVEASLGLTVSVRSGSELELAPGAIVRLEEIGQPGA